MKTQTVYTKTGAVETHSHAMGNYSQMIMIAEYYTKLGLTADATEALQSSVRWMQRALDAREAGNE